MTLTLASIAPDGTTLYLADDPDGCHPRATADPFRARPFADARAVADFLAAHPGLGRPGVRVVPWPIDLDLAVCIDPIDEPAPPPAPAPPRRPASGRVPEPMELFRWS